ncbi:hypothetical protein [Agarivorans sp. Alg241-V36]|uniref:hypothetical protein n=1 Tax=Agarivorans sp. Alg241-V36 TaxID=2305992 RepID=UPI0013D0392C|nr:hypothetical protein [Agarivorans sp. Alg241-V36]
MSDRSLNLLQAQIEQASVLLVKLKEDLLEGLIDQEEILARLESHAQQVESFFSTGTEDMPSEHKQLIVDYVAQMKQVFEALALEKQQTSEQLGKMRRGRKVSSAYNQNT